MSEEVKPSEGMWFASHDEVKCIAEGANGMDFASTIADCAGFADGAAIAKIGRERVNLYCRGL